MTAAAETLRQALDQLALEHVRLRAAVDAVRAALTELGEDPDQPSRAELDEFRPDVTAAPRPAGGHSASAPPSLPATPSPVESGRQGQATGAATSVATDPRDGWPCPVCGDVFATEHGMRGHRGRVHKTDGPAPVPTVVRPAAPAAPYAPPGRARLVLACSSCDIEFDRDQLSMLRRHVRLSHQRSLTTDDRTPVPSRQDDAT
ncbi:Zinc finger C2H2-type [uncultured Caudovirales phage]|uniref:Zinc finger C2H2-type n=1 Tax=uncultured Caudovirales phage TaxID=2100421 RepID=A0A6J5LV08_9CAUD|nr:Zinc finger C2H2-type [uncultured Caudovirales phage]